uniref:Uncharacterized protein n=1 Tax=Plectus sambesii TaxID=2011161 RepID=A0A914X5C0_9BILA
MQTITAALLIHLSLLSCGLLAQTPPETWKEHWFEHNQLIKRVFYNNDIAVYFDDQVGPSIAWLNTFVNDAWWHTKRVYGNYGTENRLYAVFHTDKYSGGHPSTYMSSSHDNRNVIDCGPYSWKNGDDHELALITHEIAHIVELSSKNIGGSPAMAVWGDSKWAEIFIYDVYKYLGKNDQMQRVYNIWINQADDFPRANTFWFRDWFYPIYSKYGENAVLNRFYEQLAQYFPKNGNQYSRGMNMGEFVHFWSGAAGVNLKDQATQAFGWTSDYDNQFRQAQSAFPFPYDAGVAKFYHGCPSTGFFAGLPVGDYRLSDMRKKGLHNDDISSIVVNPGYYVQLFEHDNFGGGSMRVTGTHSCLTTTGWNDRISSLQVRKFAG